MLILHSTLFIGFPFPILCVFAKSGWLDIGFIAQPVKTRIRIKARIHERVRGILIKRNSLDCGIHLIVKFPSFFLFWLRSNLALLNLLLTILNCKSHRSMDIVHRAVRQFSLMNQNIHTCNLSFSIHYTLYMCLEFLLSTMTYIQSS